MLFYIVSFFKILIFTARNFEGDLLHNFKTTNYGTAKTNRSKQHFRN